MSLSKILLRQKMRPRFGVTRDPHGRCLEIGTNHDKIHIIGGPGSGKTTLARGLAQRLTIDSHDLDAIAYKLGGSANYRPHYPLVERLAEVGHIAAQPSWITEGAYLWWTDELLREADVIGWLDIPWRIAAGRLIVRYVAEILAGANRGPGRRELLRELLHPRLRHFIGFLRWAARYYGRPEPIPPSSPDDFQALTRATTARHLEAYAGKVLHFREPPEIDAFLTALRAKGPATSR